MNRTLFAAVALVALSTAHAQNSPGGASATMLLPPLATILLEFISD